MKSKLPQGYKKVVHYDDCCISCTVHVLASPRVHARPCDGIVILIWSQRFAFMMPDHSFTSCSGTLITLQMKQFIPCSYTVFPPLSLVIAFKAVHVYLVSFDVVWYTAGEQVGVHCLAQGQNNRACSWDSDVVSDRLLRKIKYEPKTYFLLHLFYTIWVQPINSHKETNNCIHVNVKLHVNIYFWLQGKLNLKPTKTNNR